MFKKVLIVGLALVVIIATSITAFAVTKYNTPAEIVANITGKSVDEVTNQRYETRKTYGEIAYDEGVWEDYYESMLESKKAFLDEKVADGSLTQEQADEIYSNMLERQEYCYNNGNGGRGGMMGYGFGQRGQGRGCGRGW